MSWSVSTPNSVTIDKADPMNEDMLMTPHDTLAVARAQQDFVDGLAFDENPFPADTREALCWDDEMDQLMIQEAQRELSAA